MAINLISIQLKCCTKNPKHALTTDEKKIIFLTPDGHVKITGGFVGRIFRKVI